MKASQELATIRALIKAAGLKAGDHKLAIAFLNDIYKENEYDLNFFVHGVTVRSAK